MIPELPESLINFTSKYPSSASFSRRLPPNGQPPNIPAVVPAKKALPFRRVLSCTWQRSAFVHLRPAVDQTNSAVEDQRVRC